MHQIVTRVDDLGKCTAQLVNPPDASCTYKPVRSNTHKDVAKSLASLNGFHGMWIGKPVHSDKIIWTHCENDLTFIT